MSRKRYVTLQLVPPFRQVSAGRGVNGLKISLGP
jgi:hypothetical protein